MPGVIMASMPVMVFVCGMVLVRRVASLHCVCTMGLMTLMVSV